APVFWGVVTAFACLLPFGAWVVWVPAAVILAAGGDVVRAIVLVVLGLAVVSMADNVVRPMLLSGRAHMNGLVTFVGLLGAVRVLGLRGLVSGPSLLGTALGLLDGHVNHHKINHHHADHRQRRGAGKDHPRRYASHEILSRRSAVRRDFACRSA